MEETVWSTKIWPQIKYTLKNLQNACFLKVSRILFHLGWISALQFIRLTFRGFFFISLWVLITKMTNIIFLSLFLLVLLDLWTNFNFNYEKSWTKRRKNNFHDLEKRNRKEERKGKRVFCFEDCSNLQWDKIVLVVEEKLLKILGLQPPICKHFRLHKNNLLEQWKVKTIFETKYIFLTCYWRFLRSDEFKQIKIPIKTYDWDVKT